MLRRTTMLVVCLLFVMSSAKGQALPAAQAALPNSAVLPTNSGSPGNSQTLPVSTDTSARYFLDATISGDSTLGYKFPDVGFGASIEKPIGTHLELQGSILYDLSRKVITNNGNSLIVKESAIGWVTSHVGVMGTYERSWLWTSQFDKGPWYPIGGVAIRFSDSNLGPGRVYINYVFPTGCVWATPSNPCTIQSNRMQGIQGGGEIRMWHHNKWLIMGSLLHFCDQSNQNDPAAGRSCHFAVISNVMFRFSIHGISKTVLY